MASLYDVMGLVAPYHMTGKILLQTLWAESTKLDQDIPQETLQPWQQWISQLQIIRSHPTSRFAGRVSGSTQLRRFSDSSNRAYAAVIYIYQPNSQSQVIWCQARVFPLKQRTLPEMELEAPRLLATSLRNFGHSTTQLSLLDGFSHCCEARKAPTGERTSSLFTVSMTTQLSLLDGFSHCSSLATETPTQDDHLCGQPGCSHHQCCSRCDLETCGIQ